MASYLPWAGSPKWSFPIVPVPEALAQSESPPPACGGVPTSVGINLEYVIITQAANRRQV